MKRTTLGLIALFALIAAACVAFGAYFSYATLLNAHRSAIEQRFAICAERIAKTAERARSLGIALPAQSTLPELLRREADIERHILSLDVVDERGVVLFSSDPTRRGGAAVEGGGGRVSKPVENDLGAAVGRVIVRYDQAAMAEGAQALAADLEVIAVPTLLGAFLATVLIGLLLAASLRRAARRAADPATWPPAAKAARAALEAARDRPPGSSSGPSPAKGGVS